MSYVLVQGGVVVQKQPYADSGFIEAPESVLCGYTYDGEAFHAPDAALQSPVPVSISPRQFRQSLTHYGFRSNVETAVAASDQDTKDWYEFATSFDRLHPKVLSMAQALGYTSAQLDAVWTYGAGI